MAIYVHHLQDVPSNLFNPSSVPHHAPSDRALYRTSSLPLPRRISAQSVSDHPRRSSRALPVHSSVRRPAPQHRPGLQILTQTQDPHPLHNINLSVPLPVPNHSAFSPLPACLLLLLLPLLSHPSLHLPLNLLLPIPPRPLLPLRHLPHLRRRLARRDKRLSCRERLMQHQAAFLAGSFTAVARWV